MTLSAQTGVTVQSAGYVGTPVTLSEGIVPFIVGAAYGTSGGDATTDIKLISSLTEYKTYYGWKNGTTSPILPDHSYSLEEAAYLFFQKYGVGPVIMRNVFDDAVHTTVGDVTAGDVTAALADIEEAYGTTGYIPGMVLAPGWGEVAAVRTALEGYIAINNSSFGVMAILEGDESDTTVSAVVADLGAITTDNCRGVWPQIVNGYYSATVCAALCCKAAVDPAAGNGVPFWDGANYPADLSYASGDQIVSLTSAQTLINSGITTFTKRGGGSAAEVVMWGSKLLNFKTGNASADYINDNYIPRMMTNYIQKETVLALLSKVDNPLNRPQAQDVVFKLNNMGDQLLGRSAVLGYKIDLLEEDNPTANLVAGQLTVRRTLLTPQNMSDITVNDIIDFNYFAGITG